MMQNDTVVSIPFGELKSQYRAIEAEIRAAVDDVLDSAWYVFGKHCAAFESEFGAYVGTRCCAGVGSGTEAIHLALRAVGVGAGDEVITAANTCVPTVAGIVASGAAPVLVEPRADTLTLDPACLEAAITPRTRAIVPVHLYGGPCDMEAIGAIASAHGLAVVEDCAQAHGTCYRGRRCGTFGHAAAFSFYPSKNLGAYGDGGAVTANDTDLDRQVRMLRNYGEETRYHHAVEGVNSRLDEMQAAILRVKLRHLDAWNAARRERAAMYHERLAGCGDLVRPVEMPDTFHIYHLYVVRTADRDALQAYLRARGIATLLHYPVPIHLQKAYARLGYGHGAFPVAEAACDSVLSLPMYAEMPLEHVERVADAVRAYYGESRV